MSAMEQPVRKTEASPIGPPLPRSEGIPAAGAVPLDFEAWAALSARLVNLGLEERLDVLDQRGIDLEDWLRSDEHHCTALAADVAAGRMERADLYGRKCAAELERRRKGDPEALPPPAEVEPADAPEVIEAPPAPPVPAVGAPAAVVTEEVPSFLRTPPPAEAPPVRAPSSLTGTMAALDVPSFVRQTSANPLPFGSTPSPSFSASTSAPRPPPAASLGSTMAVGSDLGAQIRSALPFAKQDGEGAKPEGARPVSFPRLPLETYASLCAELSVFPERTADILVKYGVKDEETRRALDDDWRARFSAHADTREEWQRLCATYEGWLRKGSR